MRGGTSKIDHPQVGQPELGYEELPVPDIDCMTLVLYHAKAGSPSAQKLALLASTIAAERKPREPLRSRRVIYVNMDDQQVLSRIDELVKEEEDLLHRHEADGLGSEDHARMEELKVQLDKAWDYLRQRRALRQYGEDPDEASMRDGGTVEGYGTVKDYEG
jgi:hypothetical protein